MLNTILYNWEEEVNNEVKIGQGTSSTSAAAIVPRNPFGDNLMPAAAANTDSLFDRKFTSSQRE